MSNMVKPSGVNTIWASTGTSTDPGSTKAATGWVVELPPYQTQNWIDNKQDSFIAHSNQHGIPQWDAVTEYQGNISYSKGTDGVIYKCLVTNTNIDPANPLNSTYWVKAFESFGSVAVVSSALATHLVDYSTLANIANTAGARANLSVYSKAESDARFAALAGLSSQTFSVATATLPSHAIPLNQLNSLLTQATESTAGIAAVASNGDVATGTDNTKMVTSVKLATLYLPKAGNLAGLANTATARANLGLGSMAVESATGFARVGNNLSDLTNAVAARANLGLTSTAIQPETYFARSAYNLGDLPSITQARINLGLTSTATTSLSSLMLKSDNLAGLANTAVARNNLGLSDIVTIPANFYLTRFNNLSDLGNVQAARNNLGLGGLATRDVYGVNGNLDFSSVANPAAGYVRLPGGMTFQWGQGPALGDDSAVTLGLWIPGTIMSVQVTGLGVYTDGVGPCFLTDNWTGTSFRVSNNYNTGPWHAFTWQATVWTGQN